jgi:uncharacterized protein YggT (Ycf19 family)
LLQRTQQSFLVGVGCYLAWKHLIVGVLGLYFVSSYIFFGKQPFWQHLDLVARQLLVPLRLLPLRLGKIDLAPLVGIALVILIAHAAEHGIKSPLRHNSDGSPKARLVDVPGLVDLYRRASE